MGLTASRQIVPLGTHVLDLRQLQRAVFLGFRQGVARDIGMDVHLEALVVLTDHQTVANAVQIGPQGLQRLLPHGLADDEHGVKGEGDLILQRGEIGLFLDLRLVGHFGDRLAPQAAQHAVQNDEVALAAGVNHAGFFQHRVHLYCLGQRHFAGADGFLQHEFHGVILLRGLGGPLGGQTGNGQHRALGRLHHRAVGGGDTLLHGGGQRRAVGLGQSLQGLGHAPEQQGQDHAGVAPGAPQQTAGRYLGSVVDGGGLRLFQLGAGGLDGQVHIGARVAVRHGEHVQVVDGLLLPGDAGRAEQHHFLERGAVDLIYHLAVILP